MNDDEGDWFVDSYRILVRWRNYFSQPFNLLRFGDDRQTEILSPGLIAGETIGSEFELVIEKPNSHKSPEID